MIQTIRKIITVGSSQGVTLPTKDLKRENIQTGDEVEVIIRPIKSLAQQDDQHIIDTAKQILVDYKQDFQNLAQR